MVLALWRYFGAMGLAKWARQARRIEEALNGS